MCPLPVLYTGACKKQQQKNALGNRFFLNHPEQPKMTNSLGGLVLMLFLYSENRK